VRRKAKIIRGRADECTCCLGILSADMIAVTNSYSRDALICIPCTRVIRTALNVYEARKK
jgi:hypothetical protein